jgi:nucleotide-binding universal stress UspA family protein
MRSPIVAGVDGSEASRFVLVEAGAQAQRSGRGVTVVFVRDLGIAGLTSTYASYAIGALLDSIDQAEFHAQIESIAVLDPQGIPWAFEVHTGRPHEKLINVANRSGSDTIVVGTGVDRLPMRFLYRRSVTSQLRRRWSNSLLIVPSRPRVGEVSP